MRPDIFKVDGHRLVFDKEYLRGIPEFKVLLERKIASEGDYDGRKKLAHWQLFLYIKIRADLFSYPNLGGYTDKEVHLAAIKESKLDPAYKPDEEVEAAIVKFREIQEAQLPTLTTINTLLRGMKMSDKIATALLQNMEKQLEVYNARLAREEAGGEKVNVADQIALVDKMMECSANIQKIALGVPKVTDVLENLEERLKKETAGDTLARGGRAVGNRADPKK